MPLLPQAEAGGSNGEVSQAISTSAQELSAGQKRTTGRGRPPSRKPNSVDKAKAGTRGAS